MAAIRKLLLVRRALSAVSCDQACASLLDKEPTGQLLPYASLIFTRADFCRRRFQTQANPVAQGNNELENNESDCSKHGIDPVNTASQINSSGSAALKVSATSNLKMSSRHDTAMIFTCKVCETRSIKTICRQSYEKGVVVAHCSGCNNLHLIADRLGLFGEPGSVEEFLAGRGEEVKKGSIETLNLTLDDLAGKKVLKD
uniref:DNL-type domain-containing protein n=2 Tax=Rhizophora mucronata TaxID=61149 RepID=A0A2P2IN20_RHIMU